MIPHLQTMASTSANGQAAAPVAKVATVTLSPSPAAVSASPLWLPSVVGAGVGRGNARPGLVAVRRRLFADGLRGRPAGRTQHGGRAENVAPSAHLDVLVAASARSGEPTQLRQEAAASFPASTGKVKCILMGVLSGSVAAGSIWLCCRELNIRTCSEAEASRDEARAQKTLDEVEARRTELLRELDALRVEQELLLQDHLTSSTPREQRVIPSLQDYDQLLRGIVHEAVHRVAPSLSKGQAVRNMLEERMHTFAGKARNLLLREINSTAGDLCEAIDAPEAMLLLDLDAAVAANFPPCSALLAGLLTPFILRVYLVFNIVQLLLVLMPFAWLCTWAAVHDRFEPCDAIPTLKAWLWVQIVVVYVLIVARGILVVRSRASQRMLNEKSAQARLKLAPRRLDAEGLGGLLDLREMVVSQVSLLQQVLLVEDQERRSWARHIVGMSTAAWLVLTVWVFALVFRFMFIPGSVQVGADPCPAAAVAAATAAKGAAMAAAATQRIHCNAWATIVAARMSCFVMMLAFFSNLATVFHWASELSMTSERFSTALLNHAQKFDEGLLGLPMAQLFVRAFVLRGSSDMVFTRLAVALHEQSCVKKEINATEGRLQELRSKLQEQTSRVSLLKAEAADQEGGDFITSAEKLERQMSDALTPQAWRERGTQAIEEAHANAVRDVKAATTESIDRILRRMAEGSEQLRNSEAVQSAIAAARTRVRAASEVADTLVHSESGREAAQAFQSVFSQAQQATHTNIEAVVGSLSPLASPQAPDMRLVDVVDVLSQAHHDARPMFERGLQWLHDGTTTDMQHADLSSLAEGLEEAISREDESSHHGSQEAATPVASVALASSHPSEKTPS